MSPAMTPTRPLRYGALELQSAYQRYWALGLAIATSIHFALIGSYYLIGLARAEETPFVKVHLGYPQLGPPPSITNINSPPSVALSNPAPLQRAGIPVPIPDAQISPDQGIPTQKELGLNESPVLSTPGEVAVQPVIIIDNNAPPMDFQSVEKKPVLVHSVPAQYPELAIRVGLEGTVIVKIWVDREGKVRQASVEKSDNGMFDQPAIDAARQFVFTPAYMNSGPVSVWVSVPFHFKLTDRK